MPRVSVVMRFIKRYSLSRLSRLVSHTFAFSVFFPHTKNRINYVFGFSSGGFSYFVTTQRETTQSAKFVSKIVRLCENDEEYISYTEIPLLCNSVTGTQYNLVQVGPGSRFNITVRPFSMPDSEVIFRCVRPSVRPSVTLSLN